MITAKKGAAYFLSFSAIDSTTPASYKSGISPVDTAYYKDGAGAWTSLAITDTASEIGSTGVYEIDLTATEMNHDKVMIKFAVSGMADDAYLFDLQGKLVDDLQDITAAQVNTECDTALGDYDGPTNAEMNARTLLAASYFDPAADAVANVTLVATTTTNTDMRGTDSAATAAALATVDTVVDGIQADLSNGTDGLGAIKTAVDAIQVDVDSMGITKNAIFSNFEFPMVLTSDHYTAATAKTVTGEKSIDGAGFVAIAGSIAEVGSGVYQCDLLAADTNGDSITYKFSAADCDDSIISILTRA